MLLYIALRSGAVHGATRFLALKRRAREKNAAGSGLDAAAAQMGHFNRKGGRLAPSPDSPRRAYSATGRPQQRTGRIAPPTTTNTFSRALSAEKG